jgi:hypothetical protein
LPSRRGLSRDEDLHWEHHDGAAREPLPRPYVRHEPEKTILHQVVREHVASFLAGVQAHSSTGNGLPKFVEREFTRYLDCGILANGFARVRCPGCGFERLVAFSCKGRICPSCCTRRMYDVGAHLVDHVLPRATYRQWVLTYPRRIRFLLATNPKLVTRLLDVGLRAIFGFHRRRARRLGNVRAEPGAITFVQRFGSALNLNVHFHILVPDGLFAGLDGAFEGLPPPSDEDVRAILARIVRRTRKILDRLGLDADPDDPLAASRSASIQAVLPLGDPQEELPRPARRCALLHGYSLHAGTRIHANDRQGLERLCRYGARGPIALSRLGWSSGGRLAYRVKRPSKSSDPVLLLLTPEELLHRLAVLVPPRRVHATRYHGVFGPNAGSRRRVVPKPPPPACTTTSAPPVEASPPRAKPKPGSNRLPWAELIERTFKADVLQCPRCPSRLEILAVISAPATVRAILTHLGLPTAPPPIARARDGPESLEEPELDFVDERLDLDDPA